MSQYFNRFLMMAMAGLMCAPPLLAAEDNVEKTENQNVIISVSPRYVGSRITVGGTVTPAKSVTLAAQLPGRVIKLAGEEGDKFSEGALLVALDDADLYAKRRAAEAQWSSADAALRNAGVQFSRTLVSPATSTQTPGGMGMPGMFDQVFTDPMSSFMGTRQPGMERHADIYAGGTQMEQARSALAQAYAEIQQIDSKIRDSRSIAPFDGTITKKHIQAGDTVQPGQPLLEYADMNSLQIVADIPARMLQSVREGDEIPAKIDINDEFINVKVSTIFPMADPSRHTIRVKFDLPPNMNVAAGVYAEVRIPDAHANGADRPVVPASAIVWRGGLPMVFVVNENNRAALRLLRLGETLRTGEVVVLSGLNEDDKVLDKPAPGMASGVVLPGGSK
jgi:multidrug efflux pump subunit AcrA (membrane-fusion protein)